MAIPYWKPKWLKKHTLWGLMYLFCPYKRVPPGLYVTRNLIPNFRFVDLQSVVASLAEINSSHFARDMACRHHELPYFSSNVFPIYHLVHRSAIRDMHKDLLCRQSEQKDFWKGCFNWRGERKNSERENRKTSSIYSSSSSAWKKKQSISRQKSYT